MTGSFTAFTPEPGVWAQVVADRFRCRLWALRGLGPLGFEPGGTTYAYVQRGPAQLRFGGQRYPLAAGQYVSVPGPASLSGAEDGLVVGFGMGGVHGFFHLGGPIEGAGRLRYIDGCTDSLLIPPVVRGDPCLNLLHIPPGTAQSAHTHPSFRAGVIVAGTGVCRTPQREFPLRAGLMFMIPENVLHSFHTERDPLLVIAFHPDSDFGPTDETHPMINRTILAAP